MILKQNNANTVPDFLNNRTTASGARERGRIARLPGTIAAGAMALRARTDRAALVSLAAMAQVSNEGIPKEGRIADALRDKRVHAAAAAIGAAAVSVVAMDVVPPHTVIDAAIGPNSYTLKFDDPAGDDGGSSAPEALPDEAGPHPNDLDDTA